MYLRALEIQGFKSFPDKTVLNFGEDITAIVGPNGSGKSNISDAIRWVMGEQSVKGLRGAKMEDVIFGGTEKRSQVGFAQVTLVLDNTEHIFPTMEESEVSVTRRYYRSGESEYYINRQSVRLKDLTELFLDTGMGREGYSIIGQGKIDEILSAKSGERREIFEEAAGISKFRHRKEEAERKLERTEENLVRINDKIAELELQVEPLREQAEKARKYLVLRDELRLLEISVWLENLDTLKAGARKLEADFHAAESQRDEARAALDALYAEGERYSERMREKDMEAERVRTESAVLEEQIKEKESAAAVLESTVTHNRENIQRAEAELAEAESRSGGLAKQAEEQEARVAEIDRALRQTIVHIIAASLKEGGDPASSIAAVRAENQALQAEKARLLTGRGYPADCLDDRPFCPQCGDSGWVGSRMCACLKALCTQEQIRELSRMLDIGSQSFDTFELDWYSPDRGSLPRSPRENAQRNLNLCRDFAARFRPGRENLLLFGAPGLGKTFLSACIARVVSESGFSVVYDTAISIFAKLENDKFRPDEETAAEVRRCESCDLLILDDLGTEMTTSFVQSALYQLVNGRMIAGRSTIISTNLAPEELGQRYGAAILSRIEGGYEILPFFGEDIRRKR
ncbi:MAG: hypothetical protein EGR51_05470 [Oscillibacter sp.]|nr:hypothetical protein [Oscillibacter sp.]